MTVPFEMPLTWWMHSTFHYATAERFWQTLLDYNCNNEPQCGAAPYAQGSTIDDINVRPTNVDRWLQLLQGCKYRSYSTTCIFDKHKFIPADCGGTTNRLAQQSHYPSSYNRRICEFCDADKSRDTSMTSFKSIVSSISRLLMHLLQGAARNEKQLKWICSIHMYVFHCCK